MARLWRHCGGAIIAAALFSALLTTAAVAQDLYNRPVLAVDPGMHTARIWSLAVDSAGQFAVTGGGDRTVRIWSVANGELLRTIWIPVGPDPVGDIYAVAISPDGSTVAAGGWTERLSGGGPIYLFDRETGALAHRIELEAAEVPHFLTFSADGRYLAATLARGRGVRVFDRDKGNGWGEEFRDVYGGESYGASFAPDGRLATTSQDADGTIRLYDSKFHVVAKVEAPSGAAPSGIAFSPDGRLLAVGYAEIPAVDVLDGKSLARAPGPSPSTTAPWPNGLDEVAWSHDGGTLFAAGTADMEQNTLLAWDQAGKGEEQRLPLCSPAAAAGLAALPDGRILVASMGPCLELTGLDGNIVWTAASNVPNFRQRPDSLQISEDGAVVDFSFGDAADTRLRFDVRSLQLSIGAANDGLTFAPDRQGLPIGGWRNGLVPTLGANGIPIDRYDTSRSLAIAQGGKRFFLGSSFYLSAFDDAGKLEWRRNTRGDVWAVNASGDGRIVVAAYGDGAIRWLRADEGRELLALQVLANKTDWVLWTPEGFYEATDGAKDVLKWVVNHGPNAAATPLSVSAVAGLHRPDALPLVLDQLETARALGIADVAKARLSVQAATGSEKPPGAILNVLVIGINQFGDKAVGLHLDYAVDDARDVASALLASQRAAPGKASLYGEVSIQKLTNAEAGRNEILEAMDAMARTMRTSDSDQDVAFILFSSHGEMIDGQFYLIPYGFDARTTTSMETSSVSADEFARKVKILAQRGKVLLLLDACHSGAVGPGGASTKSDASVLRDAVNSDNVTVLTSSAKDELSQELPAWRHGAFTQAFLDAINGAADREGHGVISINELAQAMGEDLASLTKGKQHLGERVNFWSDVFVVNH